MSGRVVVTGLGAITPLGLDVPSLWAGLLAGRSGIARITRFDPSRLPVQIAGEVKGFDPVARLDPKLVKRTDRFIQYALWATIEAVQDSGLDLSKEDRSRIGVVVGSGMGGLETWEAEHARFMAQGPERISPFLIPMMIPDMASGQIAIYYHLGGPNFCTTSACSSGAHAIGEAYQLIKAGVADVMIAGGSEAPITEFCVAAFANMRAVSRRNQEPELASRPFDRDRDGFVIAEGAGIVILEELEHARTRGAKVYCELSGYGLTGDGYHITAPAPEGEGAYRAMAQALEEAGIGPDGIDYINAHGTSTELNDLTETQAIKRLFQEHAFKVAISSTKSMIGHLLGAAGAVEFLVTCLSVYEGRVHPTINLQNPDPECDLDYVPEGMREMEVRAGISNSFGFGGHNTTLLVKRAKD